MLSSVDVHTAATNVAPGFVTRQGQSVVSSQIHSTHHLATSPEQMFFVDDTPYDWYYCPITPARFHHTEDRDNIIWNENPPLVVGTAWSVVWEGHFILFHSEVVTFILNFDQWVELYVDGALVHKTDRTDGTPKVRTVSLSLSAAVHELKVVYYDDRNGSTSGGGGHLFLEWSAPTIPRSLIGPAIFPSFMITFDDGPKPGKTDRILTALRGCLVRGEPVKTGFFMVGDPDPEYFAWYEWWRDKGSVRDNPELVRAVAADGHLVGNHTQHHAAFSKWWLFFPLNGIAAFVEDEIRLCDQEIETALGRSLALKIFRPPYLYDDPGVRAGASAAGYAIVWGELVDDTWPPNISVDDLKAKALRKLQDWNKPDPCVLIFHDLPPTTCDHIGEIVNFLQDQGFRLLHFDPAAAPPPTTTVNSASALGIRNTGDNRIRLTWPLQADNFKLQVANTLTSPIEWQDVPDQPEASEDGLGIVCGASARSEFYRLIPKDDAGAGIR
jgi:peptidoglycan/xylan/chitin deacetylase (PgdA/CDA1 family)